MQNKWINDLKIALINEDIEKLALIYGEMPNEFETIEIAQEASALMAGVINMLKEKREKIQIELERLKKTIVYQKNQVDSGTNGLDAINRLDVIN